MKHSKEISRQIRSIVIPIILESMLQMSAGVVTSAMIGRLLPSDISAQGVALRISNTFYALFKGIGIGATVIIALRFGEGRMDRCRRTFEQALLSCMLICLAVVGAVNLFPRFFLQLFTTDPVIIEKAIPFLRLSTIGYPCLVSTSVVTGAFNGMGNTKTPMYLAGIANLVNIALGYLFIFGNLGCPALGLPGAALALVASQFSNAGIGLYLLYNRKKGVFTGADHGERCLSLDGKVVREVYGTGIPAAAENLFMNFSSIIMSNIILSYGTNYFAAFQLGCQAESLCDMLSMGFATASTTLMASAMGKRDDELFRAYFRQLLKSAMTVSALACAAFFLLPGFLMGLLTNNPELIEIGRLYVIMMGVIQFQLNISRVCNGTMRAAGYRRAPMVISAIGVWIIRVPLCMLFGWVLHWDIFFIWLTIVLDQTTRCIISAVLFVRGRILDTVKRLSEPAAV